jgi:predicted RNA-binding Zn-ribbon protein involved in translation (DUF1610 family)
MVRWWKNRKYRQLVDDLVRQIKANDEQASIEAFRCPWCGKAVLLGAHPAKKRLVTIECPTSGVHFAQIIKLDSSRPDWWEAYTETGVWFD